MMHGMTRNIPFGFAALLLSLVPRPVWAQSVTWPTPPQWFVYTVIFIVLIGSLLALLLIRIALSKTTWSLADALSEEAEVTAMVASSAGAAQPQLDKEGKAVMITEMRGSASRLIALMGMMGILMMFLGFGTFALYAFSQNGSMPTSIDKVIGFLAAGMTLFAPYVVNQFSAIFEKLLPK